ncbi:MAG TPA: hypothetical protein DDX98_09920 [Bacteroidales bacterium]|jgi:hypothetical protein|nr:hypothetical protein [Bacteroidales bacterium]
MKFSLSILPFLFILPLLNAQQFNQTKIPEWVKPVEIPSTSALSKYDISSGYYNALEDYQLNFTDYEVFSRTAIRVLSYSGITNASQLSITYDTSYQELNIHHLYVWRNGEKFDRTDELTFEIMHNEFYLNQGIYSGNITAYDILNDIRKGDLIEFAYTLSGDNPIFEEEKYFLFPLETFNHVDLLSYRILYPEEKDFTLQFSEPDSISYTDTIINHMHVLEIELADLSPLQLEDNIPSWVIPYSYFTISSMKTWNEVNTWAQRVFNLEEVPDLSSVFEEIFTGDETTEEQINKIINYVQDDIRYMGIESGIGSIKPFAPGQVVKQRFGDCKDKSLLLVWLLKKIGIEKAYPVLVNTSMLHQLDKLLPSNQVFNHAIVKFEYQDSIYWVDPTIAMQGGNFRVQYTPDYGKVLVIGESLDTLQNMMTKTYNNVADIEEHIIIPSLSEPAKLKITSTRYGFSADSRRSLLEYYSLEDLLKYVDDELKAVYPVVERTSEIIVQDSTDSNVFTMLYNYELDDFITDSKSSFDVNGYSIFKYEPRLLYSHFSESTCLDRDYSYALDDSEELRFRVIVEFPEEMLINDSFKSYDHDAYLFEEKVEQLNPKTIKLEYLYNNKVKFVRAEDYKEFCEERKQIIENLPTVFYFPN